MDSEIPISSAGGAAVALPTRAGTDRLPGRRPWYFKTEDVLLVLGLVVLAAMATLAIAAPLIAPYDPVAQDIKARLSGPSASHLLGADYLGRDLLSRLVWGARTSLAISGAAIGMSAVVGVFLGALAAHKRGRVEDLIVWVSDLLLVFPTLILSLAVVVALGQGTWNVMASMAVAFTPRFMRLARGSALSVEQEDYVMACRAAGASDMRIILRHVLPNISSEVLVISTLWLGTAIEVEASLSFLGLGVPQPEPSWGLMVKDGLSRILTHPWQPVLPGVAIFLTVLALNLAGDGLRDKLDPRLRRG